MDGSDFRNMTEYVKHKLLTEHQTMEQVSSDLQLLFPCQKGFSKRTLERFCADNGIQQRKTIDDEQLYRLVKQAVTQLGPRAGIRPIHGWIRSKGVTVSQSRVADNLRKVNPQASTTRLHTAGRTLNPVPYSSAGFGDKYHLDQNEKLINYVVTVVIIIDGYSRMIMSHAVMPIKNNVVIYEKVYRPAVLLHGMCRQIRTDYGKEFELIHYVQTQLLSKESRRTKSSKNLAVERQWVDLNSRVFYPIKQCLINMEEQGDFSLDDVLHKYAVSVVSCMITDIGVTRFVVSHNNQYVQGRGVPLRLSQSRPIREDMVPSVETALGFAEAAGHSFRPPSVYGEDPLSDNADLCEQRMTRFKTNISLHDVYDAILTGRCGSFKAAIDSWVQLTTSLSQH